MKNYVSPVIFDNEELAEGVYATGSGCYTVEGHMTQSLEEGRWNYCYQFDAVHSATHHGTEQVLHITFNQPVKFVSSSGATNNSGSGSCNLAITYGYHQNNDDKIGGGAVYVEPALSSDIDIEVLSAYLECNMTCEHNQ